MATQQDKAEEWVEEHERAIEILNVRSEVARRQKRTALLTDRIGYFLARPGLFLALLAVHLGWIVVNLPVFPWFAPWDPYPFVLLATITSVEAPFLALLIMMYQRRQSHVAELRDELALQVCLHLERQSTLLIRLLREVQQKNGIETQEEAELLDSFSRELDARRLMANVHRELTKQAG